MKLFKTLMSSWFFRIAVVIAMSPGVVFLYLKLSGHLDPGPVTAMRRNGVSLGGYASHAEFEQECKHCHAPIHCITDHKCQNCHHEIAKQRMVGDGLHALLPGTNKCQTCHVEHQGRDAVITEVKLQNVDHAALTGYSLAVHKAHPGGEAFVCEDCHVGGLFASSVVNCVDCHTAADEALVTDHVGRFGGDCLQCHDGHDRMLAFDHQEIFGLEGAHAEAACEGCHQDHVFAGMTRTCESCHGEPDHHAGQFGTDCARCHSVAAWSPAQLTQHTFNLSHADEDEIPCATCHVTTYAEHTCYGCHEHDPESVTAYHKEHEVTEIQGVVDAQGAVNLEACANCHATGDPDELARLRDLRAEGGLPAHLPGIPTVTQSEGE